MKSCSTEDSYSNRFTWQQSNGYRQSEYSIVCRRISQCQLFRMDFKSILNAELLKQAMRKEQIGMISMPQVRVDIIGRAMQLVGNHTHFHAIQE